ncbi:MAG: DUF2911 domain-containing protein [Gemmatimonadales bacterium]
MTGIALSFLILAPPPTASASAWSSTALQQDTACIVMRADLAERPSPLDSLTFEVGGHPVKLCYGRPSARGRTMIGGQKVPFGKLWRTGANEPTMIHTTAPISVAGVAIDAGSYSLYTVPGAEEWVVILNRSITQWGHESRYRDEVAEAEVGRGTVPSEQLSEHVETMTFRAEQGPAGSATLILEWEHTRMRIPVTPRVQ